MKTVVVLEDQELIRTMLEINLRTAGYDALGFGEAVSMLEFVRDRPVHLFLLDIMLPGPIQGDEVLRVLRDRGQTAPVIMLTARNDTDLKVETLDSGADDYVTKPFDMNELLARVRGLLRKRKY